MKFFIQVVQDYSKITRLSNYKLYPHISNVVQDYSKITRLSNLLISRLIVILVQDYSKITRLSNWHTATVNTGFGSRLFQNNKALKPNGRANAL